MFIDLLIPTCNQAQALDALLRQIGQQLLHDNLHKHIRVLISDDASEDDTPQRMQQLQERLPTGIRLHYKQLPEAVGWERNLVALMSRASADYVLLLLPGEQLPEGMLRYYLQQVRRLPNLGCVLPARTTEEEQSLWLLHEQVYTDPAEGMPLLAHRLLQPSGLMLRREGLLAEYLSRPDLRTSLPQVFFGLRAMSQGTSVFAPQWRMGARLPMPEGIGLLLEAYKPYSHMYQYMEAEQLEDLLWELARRLQFRKAWPSILQGISGVDALKELRWNFRLRLKYMLLREALV